jgi:hypothetical protein
VPVESKKGAISPFSLRSTPIKTASKQGTIKPLSLLTEQVFS